MPATVASAPTSGATVHDAAFVEDRPFADLPDWFCSVVEDVRPHYIVAIARGAVRLLQLLAIDQRLDPTPVISHYALPFLSQEALRGRRVLLFDDSVIYGSTMHGVFNDLTNRGALVSCASYVVDRHHFYGDAELGRTHLPSPHARLPLFSRHRIGLSAIRRHHDVLVQTLLRTPSDYNLDFPAIVFRLNDADSSLFTAISVALEQSPNLQEFVEVTVSEAARAGVHRGTAHLRRSIWPLEETSSASVRDYSKVRFTLSVPAQELRLRPLPQLTLADDIEASALSFSDPHLAQYWNRLTWPVSPISSGTSPRTAGLFRLLTAFLTVAAGDLIARELGPAIQDNLASDPYLDTPDPSVVLTQENSAVLAEMFSSLHRRQDPIGTDGRRAPDPIEPDDKDRKLLDDFKRLWKSTSDRFLPCIGDTAYESVSKLLLSLHDVTDTDAIRVNHPDASRLDVGLSYYGIVHLLREHCSLHFSDREIGLGIDIAVDNGQAVPKVLRHGAFWTRRFYSGEARLGNAQLQFKAALYEQYSSFVQTHRAQLSPFEMTKVCVTLKDLCPRLPISTHYRTFGRTATIGQDELTDWLTKGVGAPFRIDKSGKRDLIELNPEFHRPVDSGGTDSVGLDFSNLFLSIAPVCRKVPSDAIVLLSTCRTHRHTYNAVALEAHNWAGRDERGLA